MTYFGGWLNIYGHAQFRAPSPIKNIINTNYSYIGPVVGPYIFFALYSQCIVKLHV